MESTEHLRPWMAWATLEPLRIEHRTELLERWEREWRRGAGVNYATLLDDQVAGCCGFHTRRGPGVLEIGYWTHASFRRRGVATNSSRLLTDVAFRVPGVERVEIHHDKANRASAGVPNRLGYRFIGEQPDLRTAPAEAGIDCVWAVTRAEWLRTGPSATIESGPRSSAG